MNDVSVKEAGILIVDDQETNVILLERLLEVSEFTNVISTTDSSRAVAVCAEAAPDIVLLDLNMPAPDGFEVMAALEPWIRAVPRLPIVVLTADASRETKLRALSAGASDFLSKPFDTTEVLLRIENLLQTRLLAFELRDQNRLLDQRVRERTRDLEESRLEVVDRLALAADYRDDATGEHAQRVGVTSARIARELGLPDETVELIRQAAPLHDVGKLAVADDILVKDGPLTPLEREAMKIHVVVGHEILADSRSPLLQIGAEIALTHHERWDGSGYVSALEADAIPISGRIVAVADAFDALTSRCSFPPRQALDEIRRFSGRHFDPRVVAALVAAHDPERTEAEPTLSPTATGAP